MNLSTNISTEELAEQIAAMGHDVAKEIILAIDSKLESYDFTVEVAKELVTALKGASPPEEPFSFSELE